MTRKRKTVLIVVTGAILLLLLNHLVKAKKEEINRITSPDGAYCAVILRWKAWLKDDFNYEVYLAKKEQKDDYGYPVFRGCNSLKGLEVTWNGNNIVNISYDEGNVEEFRNMGYIYSGKIIIFDVEIRLIQPFLKKIITDPNNVKLITINRDLR